MSMQRFPQIIFNRYYFANYYYSQNLFKMKYSFRKFCIYKTSFYDTLIHKECHYEPLLLCKNLHTDHILLDKDILKKPSSQVEVTVMDLKDKVKTSGEKVVQIAERKTLWRRIADEIVHYYHGFRLLFIDVAISSKYIWKLLNGKKLTRREYRQLVRTTSDLFRLLPFSVFIIVPFMELLLPVALKLFPGMLPSTFETANAKEAKMKKTLKIKLEYAKFLQETLDSMALTASKGSQSDGAKEFVKFFDKIRKTGEPVSNEEILKFSKLFEDEITLDSLSRGQLIALCKLLEVPPIGTNNFLRFQLRMKLRSLSADDKIIESEGLDALATWELQQACKARGMRAYGLSENRLRLQLQQWLDLSLNEKVPPSLLLLSRTLYLPESIPASDTLVATISVLPDEVATRAKHRIAKTEGKVDNRARLEVIKTEERKIKEEKEEVAKDLEEKKKKEALIKKKEEEIKRREVILQTEMQTVSSKDAPLVSAEQLTAEDLKDVEEALETLGVEKHKLLIEEQELSELKSELADYQEDLEDFKSAMKESGLDEQSLKESKAARRLFVQVNKMLNRLDPVMRALGQEKESLQKMIDSGEANSMEKIELVSLEELFDHLAHICNTPDISKVEMIQSVLTKIDLDHDGAVKVEDVMRVLKLLSEEQVGVSPKVMEDVLEMLSKEEQLEAQTLIQRALENTRNAGFKILRDQLNEKEHLIKNSNVVDKEVLAKEKQVEDLIISSKSKDNVDSKCR